ncbi:MAG: NAD(+)/NADH kinase [Ruminococcus sp.]|nr:NAD(+)/NADH kinase [Ruminococcus sp.]MDE7226167.1 NAD(+)/NADH kinase [Ruminococcus sp.]
MKAALFPNFQKKNALSCALEVCDMLYSCGIEVSISTDYIREFNGRKFVLFEDIEKAVGTSDIFIAIGGDGTILRCAKHLIGTDILLLGINTGTLGFMAGLEAYELDKLAGLKTGKYDISQRMTIDMTLNNADSGDVYTALNEISVRSGSFRICDFEVYSDGYLVGKYRADGVLFSTPSGSTAYALSAGGPVIEPDLECIEMNLICPHSLFARATMFSAYRRLTLVNRTAGDGSLVVSVDGELERSIGENESIEIVRGKNNLNFVNLIGNSFHESLCRKLCRPIK